MANGTQKPDHNGNFFMVPRSVIDSMAWRCASLRAKALLQVFQARHNGFNNGQIGASVKGLSAALGDQNHGATSRAIAELIGHGFLECTSDASQRQTKARTYRITFIPTGEGKNKALATNEFRDWRPQPGTRKAFGSGREPMKFGVAAIATQEAVSVADTATRMKFHVADTATNAAATPGVAEDPCVAATATLIGNHLPTCFVPSAISSRVDPESIAAPLNELREWLRAAIASLGFGGAKALATDAGIPEPTLSRFRSGRSIPERYRRPLHEACARALPYDRWRAAA